MASSTTTAGREGRPVLRPGCGCSGVTTTHLQVGIDEPRVVLPDTEGVRRLLRDLDAGEGLASLTPEAGLAFGRLLDAGLVVERADVVAAARDERRQAATAAFAAHGPSAPARLASRAVCRVALVAPEPWQSTAADLLAVAGLAIAVAEEPPAVTLVVSCGEPVRSRIDLLIRGDRAHLLVALLPHGARIGPFVAPGVTACLRCVDAHLAEDDPRRGLVLEQLEDPRGRPVPADPVLAHGGARARSPRADDVRRGRPAGDLVGHRRPHQRAGIPSAVMAPAPALRVHLGVTGSTVTTTRSPAWTPSPAGARASRCRRRCAADRSRRRWSRSASSSSSSACLPQKSQVFTGRPYARGGLEARTSATDVPSGRAGASGLTSEASASEPARREDGPPKRARTRAEAKRRRK